MCYSVRRAPGLHFHFHHAVCVVLILYISHETTMSGKTNGGLGEDNGESHEKDTTDSPTGNGDELTQNNSVRIADENSGNVFTVNGGPGSDLTINQTQDGDKETTETVSNVVTNILSRAFGLLYQTAVGKTVDTPLKATGWLSFLLLAVLGLGGPVEHFARLFGHEQIAQNIAPLAAISQEVLPALVTQPGVYVAVALVIAIVYALLRTVTYCGDCDEPFLLMHLTELDYKKGVYDEEKGRVIPEKSLKSKCRNCGSDGYSDIQHSDQDEDSDQGQVPMPPRAD